MNREHRYNTLTPNFIKQLSRGIETLNLEDLAKVIYMTPQNEEHFSNGTDFRTLAHYKSAKDYSKIAEYLNDLYGLQIQVATCNKPIMTIAPGHSFNSGASLLQASGIPIVTQTAMISFNDVTFGFVPHGGSTFYLSRLPNETGTFMCLTGLPMNATDSMEFKLAEKWLIEEKGYHNDIGELMQSLEHPIPNAYLITNKWRNIPWKDHLKARKNGRNSQIGSDALQRQQKNLFNMKTLDEEAAEFGQVPYIDADSEFKHKMLMRQHAEANSQMDPGYLESDLPVYQNYYDYVASYLHSHIGHPYSKKDNTFIKHTDVISRCFISNNVEEIMDLLKKDNSAFAKLCLERMKANSMLSMKIALKMLRDARNLDFKGILEMELNVGLNKIQDKDFDLGVKEILMKPSKMTQKNPGFKEYVDQEEVNSYFEVSKWTKNVNLGVVENAMLPTRFYYRDFSDQVRLWVNETSTTQSEVREAFEFELKDALRDQGIDIRDKALTIKSARDMLYSREKYNRKMQLYWEKMNQFALDKQVRETYFEKLNKEIEGLEAKKDGEFFKIVNQKIQGIFEQAYMDKLGVIFEKSKKAHDLEKRRMFIRFKQYLFQSRILTYATEEFDRLDKQLDSMPSREVHLKEDWKETYLKMEHPDIKKSFLWYLQKAVGIKSIAPAELVQQYLTNPSLQKQSTLFTFDKEQLLKLRDDVFQNPEKYEDIFLSARDSNELIDKNSAIFRQQEEYEFWYRAINQGRCPIDNIKWNNELQNYKRFVNQVEQNTLNTFKLTITRMLLDFEPSIDQNNQVVEFTHPTGESKGQALRRLYQIMNQQKKAKPAINLNKKEKRGEQKLIPNKSALKSLKPTLQGLIKSDPLFKSTLWVSEETMQDNVLIKLMQDELLEQLIKMIEGVLLKNKAGELSREQLEEIFVEVTTPINAQQNSSTTLAMLDNYLKQANKQELIKDCFNIVKPYFLELVSARIEEEMEKIFDAFEVKDTFPTFLYYYLMHLTYPDLKNLPIVERIKNHNIQRDKQKYLDVMFPEDRYNFRMKQFLQTIGNSFNEEVDSNTNASNKTIAEQQHEMSKYAEQAYKALNKFQKSEEEKEITWQKQTQKRSDLFKKTNVDWEDLEKSEVEPSPEYDFDIFSSAELDKLFECSNNADRVHNYMAANMKEITKNLSSSGWMHIYTNCVNSYDMDVQMAIRYSVEEHKYNSTNFLERMQKKFNGNQDLTWNKLADYGTYLKGFSEELVKVLETKDGKQNYIEMSEYFEGEMNMKPASPQEEARQASIYDMITKKRHSLNQTFYTNQSDILSQDITDFVQLQKYVENQKQQRAEIQIYLKRTDGKIKEQLLDILEGDSQYLNLDKILSILKEEKHQEIQKINLIDSVKLVHDYKTSPQHKNVRDKFFQDYGHTNLDVVSLHELKEKVTELMGGDPSTYFIEVLKDLNQSLRSVPNSHRKELTLGEFLNRHHSQNSGALYQFTSDVLKNNLTSILGENKEDLKDQDKIIAWEYGNNRTNPFIHKIEDEKDEDLAKMEKARGATNISRNIEFEIGTMLKEIATNTEPIRLEEDLPLFNETQGRYEIHKESQVDYTEILKDAQNLLKIPIDFEPVRAQYENDIILKYCQMDGQDYDQNDIQKLVSEYTEARLKDCLMRGEILSKIKDKFNGHIYLKALKDNILEELNLAKPTETIDLAFKTKTERQLKADQKIEFEAIYNTTRVNTTKEMGYENFEKRLQIAKPRSNDGLKELSDDHFNQKTPLYRDNEKQTRDLAHSSIFDKLLADYFLNKRGQIKQSNELLTQLCEQFDKRQFSDDNPNKTKDTQQVDLFQFPFEETDNNINRSGLTLAVLKQRLFKKDIARINPGDYVAMMELDIATAQQLQNNQNGLREDLRNVFTPEETHIPEYFLTNDARKPPNVWLDQKLDMVLKRIFDVRKDVEKTMTRRELIAYDRVLHSVLDKKAIMLRIREELEQDKITINLVGQAEEMSRERQVDDDKQSLKEPNRQQDFNDRNKNQDGLYKVLAYGGMLEKDRGDKKNKGDWLQTETLFGVIPEDYQ